MLLKTVPLRGSVPNRETGLFFFLNLLSFLVFKVEETYYCLIFTLFLIFFGNPSYVCTETEWKKVINIKKKFREYQIFHNSRWYFQIKFISQFSQILVKQKIERAIDKPSRYRSKRANRCSQNHFHRDYDDRKLFMIFWLANAISEKYFERRYKKWISAN